jgi:hypothetical protein
MKATFVGLICMTFFLASCCGQTAPTAKPAATLSAATEVSLPTETAAPLPKVGQRVESGGIAVTVNSLSRVDKLGDLWTPKEGNIYLLLDVTLETTTRDTAPYNMMYFKVKDADGFEYSTAFGTPEPSINSGDLAKGEKVRGNVAFEVKKTSTGLVMTYEPLVILGGYVPIKIDLGE